MTILKRICFEYEQVREELVEGNNLLVFLFWGCVIIYILGGFN